MYEETKDIPEAEMGKRIREKARKAAEKYGFQLIETSPYSNKG
jgi:hypothetical protein